jgi:hypothetical protein
MNATSTIPDRPTRRPGFVGPTILIAAGIVFLLNNLGLLSWDIWGTLLSLWPVLLIALGLDVLVGRRSALDSLLVAVLVLLTLGVAIWYVGAWPTSAPLGGETIAQPLAGAERANVTINMRTGTLQIGALPESENLIAGTAAHDARDRLAQNFSVNGNAANYTLRALGQAVWIMPFGERRADDLHWELRLNNSVPLNLDIATGAGAATLDLATLNVENLHFSSGVGATTLVLPRDGRLVAQVNGGVGQTTITIPAGVAAHITATAGIGQVQVLGDFGRDGSAYVSTNYATADNRVDLTVSGGIGSITIQQESGR